MSAETNGLGTGIRLDKHDLVKGFEIAGLPELFNPYDYEHFLETATLAQMSGKMKEKPDEAHKFDLFIAQFYRNQFHQNDADWANYLGQFLDTKWKMGYMLYSNLTFKASMVKKQFKAIARDCFTGKWKPNNTSKFKYIPNPLDSTKYWYGHLASYPELKTLTLLEAKLLQLVKIVEPVYLDHRSQFVITSRTPHAI